MKKYLFFVSVIIVVYLLFGNSLFFHTNSDRMNTIALSDLLPDDFIMSEKEFSKNEICALRIGMNYSLADKLISSSTDAIEKFGLYCPFSYEWEISYKSEQFRIFIDFDTRGKIKIITIANIVQNQNRDARKKKTTEFLKLFINKHGIPIERNRIITEPDTPGYLQKEYLFFRWPLETNIVLDAYFIPPENVKDIDERSFDFVMRVYESAYISTIFPAKVPKKIDRIEDTKYKYYINE